MKRFLRILLTITNIIVIIVLGFMYYNGFDIQWGLTAKSLIWGLPLIISGLTCSGIIFVSIKRSSWKWGIRGLAVGGAAIIYFLILINFYSSVLLPIPEMDKNLAETKDNEILSMIFEVPENNGYYQVIDPQTRLGHEFSSTNKKWVKDYFLEEGYDAGILVDMLFEKNQQSVQLTLKSAPDKGYYVDYEGYFLKYFEDGGGGWSRWYRFHPRAGGLIDISLPVYDSGSGYILIYIEQQYQYLVGSGDIYLFQYTNGETIMLTSMNIWKS